MALKGPNWEFLGFAKGDLNKMMAEDSSEPELGALLDNAAVNHRYHFKPYLSTPDTAFAWKPHVRVPTGLCDWMGILLFVRAWGLAALQGVPVAWPRVAAFEFQPFGGGVSTAPGHSQAAVAPACHSVTSVVLPCLVAGDCGEPVAAAAALRC